MQKALIINYYILPSLKAKLKNFCEKAFSAACHHKVWDRGNLSKQQQKHKNQHLKVKVREQDLCLSAFVLNVTQLSMGPFLQLCSVSYGGTISFQPSFGITGMETELLTEGEGLVLRRVLRQVRGEITHTDLLIEGEVRYSKWCWTECQP